KYKLRKIEENIKKLEIDIKKEEDFIKDHPSKYHIIQEKVKIINNLENQLEASLKKYYNYIEKFE
ncbi:MAG: hypothetical protein ACQEQE_08820, partial [Bacillota bacterium]